MRRRDLFALVAAAAAWPFDARTQQKAMPVIGWLHSLSADRSAAVIDAFRDGLRRAGYIEGENVAIEYRWADGVYERLPELALDLVARKVRLILTGGGTKPIVAAKNSTATIPIVFSVATDPVKDGLVASLARPGGNITGISFIGVDLLPKRVELLTELLPLTKVFGLLVNPTMEHSDRQSAAAQEAARKRGIQLHVLKAATEGEIEGALSALARLPTEALVVGDDAFFYDQRTQLAVLAARYSLPAIYSLRGHVDAGGLMSYGTTLAGAYRQAATLVGKILAGANPAELPVEQPTKFELVINMKTAHALGLTVPQSLLARADEVIE